MPAGSVFYDNWHHFLADSPTNPSHLQTTAGTGTAMGEFYDASEVDVTVAAERSLVWIAFPRQVLVDRRDDRRAALSFADSDVATRDPQNEYCEWHVTRNAAGNITKVVLAARGIRHVYVDGAITIQRFLHDGLIQRLIIKRAPVLIGAGIPLFGVTQRDIVLKHIGTRQYASGLVQSEYEVGV